MIYSVYDIINDILQYCHEYTDIITSLSDIYDDPFCKKEKSKSRSTKSESGRMKSSSLNNMDTEKKVLEKTNQLDSAYTKRFMHKYPVKKYRYYPNFESFRNFRFYYKFN